MISVIVPAYNAEKYIDRCMQSIHDQTMIDIEIIVVDDGSTDGTWALLQTWQEKDERVKTIHQENQGLSGARNTGLQLATGEYIFFIDSDDWLVRDTFDKLINKQKETEADIVACGFRWVYEDGRSLPFTENKEFCVNGEEAVQEMILGRTLCSVVWNKLYKRELFIGESFPPGKKNEDEFITYRLLYKAKKVAYVGECLYEYFQNDNGLMSNIYREQNYDQLDALWERSNWLRAQGKRHLASLSDIELLNHVKYLYRAENVKPEGRQKLKTKYLEYSKVVLNNSEISFGERIKIHFWRLFL